MHGVVAWPMRPSNEEGFGGGKGREEEAAEGLTLGPCRAGPWVQSQQGTGEQPQGQRHVHVSSG